MRWAEPASADFLGIVEQLKARNPTAARRVGGVILDTVEMLESHHNLGMPGRSSDTRELSVASFPYLVVYTIEPGAMLWPLGNDQND